MSSNQIGRRLQEGLQQAIEYASRHLSSENKQVLLGPELAKLSSGGSGKSLLALACRADGLRVVFNALLADGKVTKEELAAIGGFLGDAAETFAKVRTKYAKFKTWQSGLTKEFLETYKADAGSFGLRDEATAWGGIAICRKIYEHTGDDRALEALRNSLYAAAEDLVAADGIEEAEQEFLEELKQLLGLADESESEDHEADEGAGIRKVVKPNKQQRSGGKYYFSSMVSSFTLRYGQLRIDYSPTAFGPGSISFTRETKDPTSYCEEITEERFEALHSQVMAALNEMLSTNAAAELEEISFEGEEEYDEEEYDEDEDEEGDDEEDSEDGDEELSEHGDSASFASQVRQTYHEMIGLPGSTSEASGDPGEQLVNECERLLARSKGQESITRAIEKFIESHGESSQEILHTLTQHDDWQIRDAALAAAGKQLGKSLESETVFPVCIQKSFDEDSDVRSTAFGILRENSQLAAPFIMNLFLSDPVNCNPVGLLFELFHDDRLEIAEKLKGAVPQNPGELTGADRVAVGCVFERIASLKLSEWQSLEEREGELTREEKVLCVKLRKEALQEAEWAVKLDPSLQRSCWGLLADLKRQAGDSSLAEALELYNESNEAESWDEKSTLLKKSLAAAPTFYWSHNNLAWHLAAAPDPEERDGAAAVKHALKACELDGYHYWSLLDTLAAAYAENGQFDKAVQWIKKAISNSPDDTSELEDLLERYQSGEAYPYEQSHGDDDESNEDSAWEFSPVKTNQGSEEGRDRSYLLVPLDDFVRNAGFSKSEIEKIKASKTKTWWDKGWDVDFRATVGRKLDELGFCNEPGELQGFSFNMGEGPSLDYRLFRVHESFVSLDRKIGDLPRHDGKWFIKIYDKEEGTKPYHRLCELLGTDEIERYHWSVFE